MDSRYPDGFMDFFTFLCKKYDVDTSRVFVSFDSNPPPRLRGGTPGYYDGLLSHRDRNGMSEFLITVYRIARDPLLTLGHEFAHLVDDLSRGNVDKSLGPPDEDRERGFDGLAMKDLAEFRAQRSR